HERVQVSGEPGGSWTLNIGAQGTVIGPAISLWPGATFSTIPETPVDDGRCIVGARITPVEGAPGRWRYEYAVYNHDMGRAVQAFSIPAGTATITGAGFS